MAYLSYEEFVARVQNRAKLSRGDALTAFKGPQDRVVEHHRRNHERDVVAAERMIDGGC